MGALNGLKILDFSTLLPGPYASLILADLGAEVLKVSAASRPDQVINYEPFIEDTGISACHAWLGRNKKTMFLNLKEALLEDAQIREREMVVDVPLPLHENLRVKQMGTAVKLSECPCEYKYAGYPLGYHTREIIESLDLDYDLLAQKGVFD